MVKCEFINEINTLPASSNVRSLNGLPPAIIKAAQAGKIIVPIVFCGDENYIVYLPVVLQSIIAHASEKYHYHIIILDCGIDPYIVKAVSGQCALRANFSVELKAVSPLLAQWTSGFHERLHYTNAMYGRLFIPQLCSNYERVIYTDIDVVFERDIAELMNAAIAGCYIAAVTELSVELERAADSKIAAYVHNELGFDKDTACICSGLLVFNVPLWLENSLTAKILDFMAGKKLRYPDQDAINAVCKGRICYLEQEWTCIILKERVAEIAAHMPKQHAARLDALLASWRAACAAGNSVIHYNGPVKPWHSPSIFLAEKWWHYAAETKLYAHYNHILIQDIMRRILPAKTYRIFGIPFLSLRIAPREVKYYLGKWRIAKKQYRRGGHDLYILGLKVLSADDK